MSELFSAKFPISKSTLVYAQEYDLDLCELNIVLLCEAQKVFDLSGLTFNCTFFDDLQI